jgi:hypothetical protein
VRIKVWPYSSPVIQLFTFGSFIFACQDMLNFIFADASLNRYFGFLYLVEIDKGNKTVIGFWDSELLHKVTD